MRNRNLDKTDGAFPAVSAGAALQTVVVSLHPCTPQPEDLEHLWCTLCGETPAAIGAETSTTATETAGGGTAAAGSPRRDYLSWFDFLHGMARVCHDPRAARLMDLNRPNEWALISLLIDVKFSAEEVCPPRNKTRHTSYAVEENAIRTPSCTRCCDAASNRYILSYEKNRCICPDRLGTKQIRHRIM
jgi:hypothetical protein